MGKVDVCDRLIDFLNAVVPVRKCVCRAMVWIVAIEPARLQVEFIPFLEMRFDFRTALVYLRKSILPKDGGWEEAHELDGRQCFVNHLLGCAGRWLCDGW